MKEVILGANVYHPTSPRTGLSGKTLLRMKNLILAGAEENTYLQVYKGSLNLDETIPGKDLTGTLDGTVSETTITGTGTQFTTEIQTGQGFWADDDFFVVDTVISDTSLTVYKPLNATLSGATGTRTPVLFELNRQRGTLSARGNAVQVDRGSIFATGVGTLLVNGVALQGGSMVLTGSPAVAIFDSSTGNYTVYPVGFDVPTPAPALTDAAGGSQGMVAGDYSVRLTGGSSITGGESNPGIRANVSLSANGHQIQVDISSVTFDTAAGVDECNAYATQFGVVNVNQGNWNFVLSHPLSAGSTFFLDYLNANIARQGELSFDANPPPDAGFVATLQGYLQWVSCYGQFGGPPGPVLLPSDPLNIEAAPAVWEVTSSPPEPLLDVVSSQARLYFPCPSSLQQGVYAPTGDPLVPPTQIRTFWSLGFASFQQLTFAQNMLVGYPHGGPTRSNSDSETVNTQFLGAQVSEIIQTWTSAYVKVGWDADPMVNAICFFQPAIRQNDDGWWETDVLLWGINQQDWIGAVTLTSTEQDMVICSVATVKNQLTFLAGGRVDDMGTIQFDTFHWNQLAGDPVDYYGVWQLQAGDVLNQNKTVRAMKFNGKVTVGELKIYGFDSATPEDLTDLETGNDPQVTIILGTTSNIETSSRIPMNAPNNVVFTARVSGTFNGTDSLVDQINGLVLEFMEMGGRR